MSVKKVVLKQYQTVIDNARAQMDGLAVPTQGWLRTLRNALECLVRNLRGE